MAAYLLGDFIGTIYKFPISIRNKCEMVTPGKFADPLQEPFPSYRLRRDALRDPAVLMSITADHCHGPAGPRIWHERHEKAGQLERAGHVTMYGAATLRR